MTDSMNYLNGVTGLWQLQCPTRARPERLNFIGLLVISDPIRPDSKAMIEKLRDMGVRPLMLTGDNLSIAKEIAHQASVGDTDNED